MISGISVVLGRFGGRLHGGKKGETLVRNGREEVIYVLDLSDGTIEVLHNSYNHTIISIK
jgi:hypothetical protein